MKHGLFFALFVYLSVACQRKQDKPIIATFEASVLGIDGDCKLPLLDFGSRTAEVEKLVGVTSANKLYYALNLDPTYSKAATNLQVTIRKSTASEERACTAMGPAYPSITVTSAVAK